MALMAGPMMGGAPPPGAGGAAPPPMPAPPSGPAAAPVTAGGPNAGKDARVATRMGLVMKTLLASAAELDPQSDEARAIVDAYRKLASTFKPASGPLEQSEVAALGRSAAGGPGVFNEQQKQAFLQAMKASGGMGGGMPGMPQPQPAAA